jgi:2,6-dihydroxypyridine 3-monooxygenase
VPGCPAVHRRPEDEIQRDLGIEIRIQFAAGDSAVPDLSHGSSRRPDPRSRAELIVLPGAVQTKHLEALHSAADVELPSAIAELVQRTAQPFVQVIVDLEVPQMAFGRSCLIGDAAFALRPHIGAGTARAADDAWQLGNALLHTNGRQIPVRLKSWEAQQLPAARRAMQRARAAGRSVQFEGSWQVGNPSPFGLYVAGDSALPAGLEQKGISNA